MKVSNRDFYSIDYNSMIVAIAYRGKRLGYVLSDHGHVKARGSSYINATMDLKGVEIISDVIPLIEDFTKGEIEFDTVIEIGGQLGLGLLEVPLQVILASSLKIPFYGAFSVKLESLWYFNL